MLELWQTEWCPASRRVRQRLTELGVDYITRQVPVEQDDRDAAARAHRHRHDPRPRRADGAVARRRGRDHAPISTRTCADPAEARAHRLKAEKARRRYLEEECECSQPATP